YTAVGDTVNVAARLEELNKKLGTEILITHSTYSQATRNLNVKKLSTATTFRGRKKMIQCYELKRTTISE
ncbi:MAG: hypothetical protein GXP32_06615, partial [Kiritimatiellaeota bacterium]|nr:hypothetical protein [Kiritimatiellota bacterium]